MLTPLHQEYSRVRNGSRPPNDTVVQVIAKKRNDEFEFHCSKYRPILCLRPYRMVYPNLYLAACPTEFTAPNQVLTIDIKNFCSHIIGTGDQEKPTK